METSDSGKDSKDKIASTKVKGNVKHSKQSTKPFKSWRKNLYKDFQNKKSNHKKRVKTKHQEKNIEVSELPETISSEKQVEKVKKKLKSKVQRDGPNKDLKRLQRGPKQDSREGRRKEGMNKPVPHKQTEFRKVKYIFLYEIVFSIQETLNWIINLNFQKHASVQSLPSKRKRLCYYSISDPFQSLTTCSRTSIYYLSEELIPGIHFNRTLDMHIPFFILCFFH